MSSVETLTITRPDDWHLHFRDGVMLSETVPSTANVFGRAIVMPNLNPPVSTVALAHEYRERIMANVPEGRNFQPLMTIYLTEETTVEEVAKAAADPYVTALKLYPAGATTNSAFGVRDPFKIWHIFEAAAEHDIPLLFHGEVIDKEIDVFDLEAVFIDRYLSKIREAFPSLRIVMEHITTSNAVEYIKSQHTNTAATITPHHLMMNRNDILAGGIKPHNYCLPVLKRNTHQRALQEIAISGDARFFLGTDSAPHTKDKKENACGCAGCYSARAALPLYTTIFDQLGALDKLEDFASHFGPDFYQLPRHSDTVTLVKEDYTIDEYVDVGGTPVVPWQAGLTVPWRLA